MPNNGVELNGGVDGAGVWSALVLPLESQDSMSVVNVEGCAVGKSQAMGDAVRYDVCYEATNGWTRRVRIAKAPEEREMNPDRKIALELSVRFC